MPIFLWTLSPWAVIIGLYLIPSHCMLLRRPTQYDASTVIRKKVNSTYLKAKVADDSMWSLIPGVNPDIYSVDGARRMKQNELLSEFID